MNSLAFVLEVYFALTLGTTGLVKSCNPRLFAAVLAQQKLLPARMIPFASRTLPGVEIAIGLLLAIGLFEVPMAITACLLFLMFLAVKTILFLTGSEAGCGCSGRKLEGKVDQSSLTASGIQVLLALLLLWLVTHTSPLMGVWRLLAGLIFVGVACLLLPKLLSLHQPARSIGLETEPGGIAVKQMAPTFVALDQHGNRFSLDDSAGRKRLLLFVLPGCPACPGALAALQAIVQKDPSLMALAIVSGPEPESNRQYAKDQQVRFPLLTALAHPLDDVYQVRLFPFLFALDEQGAILAKGLATDENVRELYLHLVRHVPSAPASLIAQNV